MLYIESKEKYTIQLMLQKLLDNVGNMIPSSSSIIPTESLKMAAIVVTTVPIICVYPFIQKFFINGMIIGGVKE
jgi:putative aldouronate transport system permease protein